MCLTYLYHDFHSTVRELFNNGLDPDQRFHLYMINLGTFFWTLPLAQQSYNLNVLKYNEWGLT